ncbi:NAD(P)H-dependent flavin oxidoreductase [Paenibacillus pabuli]|uniref:NAD(P)H-dependent flavin oxidoreductase n=1 Tax=Paenibacillus pabuli TaxID=1472 RepID=UPI003CEE4161
MAIQLKTNLCDVFNIRYPIVLAGMAGIPHMVPMVSAVSNAGGLGTLGAAYMSPSDIKEAIRGIRKLTQEPFSINIFSVMGADQYSNFNQVNESLNGIRTSLGISHPVVNDIRTPDYFEEQFKILLDEKVPIVSTTFGLISEKLMEKAKRAGIQIVNTATTVDEAVQAEQRGCDVIVAQGTEAGGHRGTFDVSSRPMGANIGTMALVPQIVDRVKIPVIAAGGIMDGRGLVAALSLGAQGIQMGTRFLTAAESGVHPAYKKALLESTEESTVVTNAFSGRPARGITNAFIRRWDENHIEPLPFPTQNTLTRDIRNASSRLNNPDYMALWAGQGTRMLKANQEVSSIIHQVMDEAQRIIE